jgi:hypothetical protein
MNSLTLPGLVGAALLVSGCAHNSESDYGSSVQQMVHSQTFDPAAAANPPELAPEITDGERVKNALDVYRKDVAKGSTDVKQPVVFEIGTN